MRRRSPVVVTVAVVAAMVAIGFAYDLLRPDDPAPGENVGLTPRLVQATTPAPRTLDAYRGLGTWVDAFDFDPAYQAAGASPAVTADDVDAMAAAGVKTLYVQAARRDARSPFGLTDPAALADLLVRAHRRDMRVIGWYLPTFADVDADLALLEQVRQLDVLGHRFDGVAVDIELTSEVEDHEERSKRLVALSKAFAARSGDDPVGAIVLPAVQLEVVNEQLWPETPWREMRPYYDVWLPMAYWTFRSTESGYHDGFTYVEESIRRLRRNLGDADARMHPIGGIGDLVTADELEAFARAVRETASLGGSIYDWSTLDDEKRAQLDELFSG